VSKRSRRCIGSDVRERGEDEGARSDQHPRPGD